MPTEIVAEEIKAREIKIGDRIQFASSKARRGYVERKVANFRWIKPVNGIEVSFTDDPEWYDADFDLDETIVVYREQ